MATMTISLPDQIVREIDARVQELGYSTRSEFIRNLLRNYFVGLSLESYQKKPLSEVKFELAKTGKYNQKFIESVVTGLKKSSLYAR